jgi:hypothetical protein
MDGKRIVLAAAALLMTGTACAMGAGGGSDSGGPAAPQGQADFGSDEGAGEVAVEGQAATLPELGPSVIKTASMTLEIERDGLGDAVGRATEVVGRSGGFVLSSTVTGNPGTSATLVMRVPSERFEETLARLRGVGAIQREHISGEEVGQEFVDLEARLRHLQSQEAVLLRLMDQAATISDTIRVQDELRGVQLEIERIRGRLRYLRDQTALGTITVRLIEEGAPAAVGTLGRAWDQAVEVFLGVISGLIVAVGFVVPITVLALLGLVGYRRLRPRLTSP